MNAIKWLRGNVAGFAHLSQGERSALYHFTLLWTVFEAQLMHTNGSPAKIRAIVAQLQAANLIDLARLSSALAYFRDRYWDGAGPSYHYSYLRVREPERCAVESVLAGHMNAPDGVLTGLLLIVHRLRNNLFHGPKWNDGMVDQSRNFRNAGRVLMATMDMHRFLP